MRALWLAGLVACGYPALPKIGNQDGGHDAPRDAKTDAMTDARPGDAMPDVPPGPSLTVKNYLSWCSVGINGGAMSTNASQTISATAGSEATMVAAPAAGFELSNNMWHHSDGDTGSGDGGTVSGNTSTALRLIQNGANCVWVCCPFVNPPGTGCPAADQCP
jgi:hypothetical protein